VNCPQGDAGVAPCGDGALTAGAGAGQTVVDCAGGDASVATLSGCVLLVMGTLGKQLCVVLENVSKLLQCFHLLAANLRGK
jgi:hypothetical protein